MTDESPSILECVTCYSQYWSDIGCLHCNRHLEEEGHEDIDFQILTPEEMKNGIKSQDPDEEDSDCR